MEASPVADHELLALMEKADAIRKSILKESAVLLVKASEVEELHAAIRSKVPRDIGQRSATPSESSAVDSDSGRSIGSSASLAVPEAAAAVGRSVETLLKSAADLFARASAANVPPTERGIPEPLSSAAFSHVLVTAFNSARQDAQYSHDPDVVVEAFSFVNLALQAALFAEATSIPGVPDNRPRLKLAPIVGESKSAAESTTEEQRQPVTTSGSMDGRSKVAVAFAAEEPLPRRPSGEPTPATSTLKDVEQARRPSIFLNPDDSAPQQRTYATPEEREADRERRALLFAASDRGRRSSFFDEASQRRASIIALGTDDPRARRQSIYMLTGQDETVVRRTAADISAHSFRRPSFVGPDGRETEVGSMTSPVVSLAAASASDALPFKATPQPQSFAENLPEAPLPPKIPAQVLAAWSAPSGNLPVPSSIVASTALSTIYVADMKKRKDRGPEGADDDDESGSGKKPHFSADGQKGVAY
eukprot:TRINITY_DN1860_c0_g1_i2.p1 TRINITY_DN1860_c0_g1~~TRINITY_DN1860_c0_g1_i2.p1  ORF type:complete len:505 (+),score=164.58 TRINITY_DN1860_c0_g1_i2:87-1517(+)